MAGTQELTVAVEDVFSAVSRVARAVMQICIICMQICQFGMRVCLCGIGLGMEFGVMRTGGKIGGFLSSLTGH